MTGYDAIELLVEAGMLPQPLADNSTFSGILLRIIADAGKVGITEPQIKKRMNALEKMSQRYLDMQNLFTLWVDGSLLLDGVKDGQLLWREP